MVVIEKSFPRGGVNAAKTNETKAKDEIIFGSLQKKIKKKSKAGTEEKANEEDLETNLSPRTAELINYDTVQEGMLLMGIVNDIDEVFVNISLPGRMKTRVSALEISNSYYKIAREFVEKTASPGQYQPLNQIFSIGQIVYGKVEEKITHEHGGKRIKMTLKPCEVHKDLIHSNVKKGFLFVGAIEEIQEHGYIIESGIKGMRTFLPLDKSKQSGNHFVGQLIYLKVEKVTHDKAVTTTICKEVTSNNFNMKNHAEANLDYIMPSTILQFKISNILKNGLQGTIMNETITSYVNEHQLTDALSLPEDYEVGTIHKARVLYVMPLTKLVYLSLNLRKNENEDETKEAVNAVAQYKRGEVIAKARVHHMGTGGVVVILDNKHKGLISYKSVKAPFKGNYDDDELLKKYAKKSKITVRVLGHDPMDSLYICTDDPAVVNEKYFSFDDTQPGDFVVAVVDRKEDKSGGYFVKLGKMKGFIEKLHLSGKMTEQGKVRCRVMATSMERKIVYLTCRSEYMNKKCKILKSMEEAKLHRNFMGTIVKCGPEFLMVKFFNNIQGTINRKNIPNSNYFEGQTMMFRITGIKNGQLALGLPDNVFSLGEICPTIIGNKMDSGLEVKVQYHAAESDEEDGNNDGDDDDANAEEKAKEEFIGFIPLTNLSDFPELQVAQYEALAEGCNVQAACMSRNTFSIRDVSYFQGLSVTNWQTIKPGDVLRAYVKNFSDDIVELMLPLHNYDKLIKVHWKMLVLNAFHNANITLVPEQVLYVKILSKETITKTLTVSAKLVDVWHGNLSETAAFTERYLEEVQNIKKLFLEQNKSIAKYDIGQKIKVKFAGVDGETENWLFSTTDENITGVVKASIVKKANPPKLGFEQECIILWIDYSKNLLYLSNKHGDISHIQQATSIPENLINKSGMNAKVLLKLENLILLSMKKAGNPIVYMPMRLHYNDLENSVGINLLEGEFCKIAFIHEKLPIALPESTWKLWKDEQRKRAAAERNNAVPNKKLKIFTGNETEEPAEDEKPKMKKKSELSQEPPTKKAKKSSEKENVQKQEASKAKKNKKEVQQVAKSEEEDDMEASPGFGFFEDKTPDENLINSNYVRSKKKTAEKVISLSDFWSTSINDTIANGEPSSSEEDDDEDSEMATKNKKKLTAAEKFKQNREAENRLREIEEKYADPNALPETIDQFERLVISEPNNSKNWINFMVHHLQAAEIEKAKAVGKRAIKTINFRHSEDLLNVWAALMNLDLRYGAKDDFETTLKEALTCNDPVKLYLRAMEILCNAKKNQELIEILNIVTKKYKTQPEVWKAVAESYFQIDMPEKAQQMLSRALASLPERDHVNTIVTFANLNHKHGQKDMAQTLFDQVITSYPKRVDVWCQYADVLIKDDLVDQARALMERAVLEKIPLKKMRTIFKKMLEIEQRFGKPEDVEKVKLKAADYVKAHTS